MVESVDMQFGVAGLDPQSWSNATGFYGRWQYTGWRLSPSTNGAQKKVV
jgi:hypothetical protein